MRKSQRINDLELQVEVLKRRLALAKMWQEIERDKARYWESVAKRPNRMQTG